MQQSQVDLPAYPRLGAHAIEVAGSRQFAKQMRSMATCLAWLLVRIAFDSGQTRSLVTNILSRHPGFTQHLLKTILEGSGRSGKANIMRRTPLR